MFDRLEDILIHYEELMLELSSPDVTSDAKKFQKLMKEQADPVSYTHLDVYKRQGY